MYKSEVGLPDPLWPRGVDVRGEAAKARQRLLPVTLFYTPLTLLMLWLVAASGRNLWVAAAFALAGVLFWTLLEYLVHRHVLHGPFPDGPGLIEHLLHKRFDHLHVAHHQRPWDGNHINGSIGDTLPFVVLLAALAALTPLHTFPMFLAGLVQSYVIEEWIHHSVHYYNFDSRYFRYIRRHHLYHHSRHGSRLAYGLTSDVWDIACGTQPDRALGEPVRERAPIPDAPRLPARRRDERWLRGRVFSRCRRRAAERAERTTH
jgi:4-hydroxysphinganine ceramide fatty acyl 2-hydroxylase